MNKLVSNITERRLKHYIKRRKQALEYIQDNIKQGHAPSYKELNKKFGIGHLHIKCNELYKEAKVSLLQIPRKSYKGDEPQLIKRDLIEYIKAEVSKNHYPSRREIENKFHFVLSFLFENIKDLYEKADIKYKQISSQALKNKKAEILMNIVISILPKFSLKLIESRNVCERGIDIITKDNQNNLIGIEVKAYNKYEIVKKRNIDQINKWLSNNEFSKIILITTASKIQKNVNIPQNLEILKFEDIKKVCTKEDIKQLMYIRNFSIHIHTKEHKHKKELINRYVINKYKDNERIQINQINKILKLDIYSYFKNQLELYKYCNILPPIGIINQRGRNRNELLNKEYYEIWKSKIKDYIKTEVSKNHYPSGEDINKRFKIGHIWNYMKVTDLYKEVGIKPYQERRIKSKSANSLNASPEMKHQDVY